MLDLFAHNDSSKVVKFNEDRTDFTFDFQELKRYVKFYVKIMRRSKDGVEIERSDMVPCTREIYKGKLSEEISDFKI